MEVNRGALSRLARSSGSDANPDIVYQCTSGSGGFDNGYGSAEEGYTLQVCNYAMNELIAWNTDFWNPGGGYFQMCSNENERYGVDVNDSSCTDYGSFNGALGGEWKVRGRSSLTLPIGLVWDVVQTGCTGVGTPTELCTAAAPGFTEYWEAP